MKSTKLYEKFRSAPVFFAELKQNKKQLSISQRSTILEGVFFFCIIVLLCVVNQGLPSTVGGASSANGAHKQSNSGMNASGAQQHSVSGSAGGHQQPSRGGSGTGGQHQPNGGGAGGGGGGGHQRQSSSGSGGGASAGSGRHIFVQYGFLYVAVSVMLPLSYIS